MRQPQPFLAQLLLQDSVLLDDVGDDLLLAPAGPAREGHEKHLKRVEVGSHPPVYALEILTVSAALELGRVFGHYGLATLDNKPIDYPYSPDDYRVTTLFDARGIAEIHAMLHIAGKNERLHQIAAKDFIDDHWNHNLILLGSGNANPRSDDALNSFNSPYRFKDDLLSIVRAGDSPASWPNDRQELRDRDFGLLLKLKRVRTDGRSTVYFVLAGVGPLGTQATCYFFRSHISALRAKFHGEPFACVLSVTRRLGYTSVEEIESEAVAVTTS